MNATRRGKQGTALLSLIALTAISAMICGTLLMRSFEAYHASAMTEWRLQTRAAAEGAVVLLSADPSVRRSDGQIGACLIRYGEPQTSARETRVPFDAEVEGKAERAVFAARYVAHFRVSPTGAPEFDRLERVQ